MHWMRNVVGGRTMRSALRLVGVVLLALGLLVLAASGMAQSSETKPCDGKPAEAKPASVYETFYLSYAAQANDLNDVQTALRNMLPKAKIYGDPGQDAVSLWATPEDMAMARKIIADLDRPKKVYRLTYTIRDTDKMDGDKKAEVQRFVLVATVGEKTDFRQGNRVPLVTGSYDTASSQANTQVQYIDVGLNIEVTLEGYVDGVRLRSRVERSSLAAEKSGMGDKDPVIQQAKLEDSATLTLGKALVLGEMDAPGGASKQEISVVAELVK